MIGNTVCSYLHNLRTTVPLCMEATVTHHTAVVALLIHPPVMHHRAAVANVECHEIERKI
jgi:hypothetical protein